MKRKIFVFAFTVLMMGMLCSCGQKQVKNEEQKEEQQEVQQETANELDSATVKVGLVLSGTLGDESVHDQANAGLQKVQETFGVETKYVECSDSSMYVDVMQGLCESGYQIIICDTFDLSDALATVAPSYPDVKFMILDTVVEGENITSFTYATNECAFLAGVAAAMKSESGVVAFIGGMEIPTIRKYQVGFEEGAAYINPDTKVLVKYVGNDASAWNNPATAKALTLDAIKNGADVCFQAAGASGLGVIEACEENETYAIGVNTDQTVIAPEHVLTSALTKGDQAIYLFVESFLEGDLLTGATVLDCSNDGVDVVQSKFFDDDIKTKIADCKEKIIAGEIKVTDVME